MTLTGLVKEFAKEKGADLVGVASVDRFTGAPDRTKPSFYLPDARAVVVLAMRMNDAIIDVLRRRRSSHSYFHFVINRGFQEVGHLAYEVSRFIDDQGYAAYPVPAEDPYDRMKEQGDLSHRHAAVAAGLGQIGWSNLLLTPQYGPRQMLSSVITDAPLEADPLMEGDLCNPLECGFRCAKACATHAIKVDEREGFTIAGRRFEHGKHIKWRCLWGCSSMSDRAPMPEREVTIEEVRELRFIRPRPDRTPIDELTLQARINEGKAPWCWVACLAACPVGVGAT